MFPKVASNNGHLPFWLPILGENGLISRCVEELQYALYSVGPVAAQPVSSLRSCPAAGLLQTLCWRELWLQKKKQKGAKELKWLHFLCCFPWTVPNSGGNHAWGGAGCIHWAVVLPILTLCCSCSTPQTPRLELLNPLPSDQTQPLRSPVSLFRGQHTPCGALWALPLANLGGNSQVLLQIWQATGSAWALQILPSSLSLGLRACF